MSLRLAAISIDLDEVPRYAAIHGIPGPAGTSAHAVYDRCVPRLTQWLEDESIRATFFAIGEDLVRGDNRHTIAALHDAGHEIANHSYHHRYDLTRRALTEIREDIERGADAIEGACGTRPTGFRAPGYTVTDALFSALDVAGVEYDSSVFPCPSYYAAKVAALAAMRLRGRASASIVDTPAVLQAPREPYRIGRPYWRRGDGLLELPIGVTPLQLPYIGTSLILGGERIGRATHQADARQGAHQSGASRPRRSPTPRRTASTPLPHAAPTCAEAPSTSCARCSAAVRVIREAGYELVTLDRSSPALSGRNPPRRLPALDRANRELVGLLVEPDALMASHVVKLGVGVRVERFAHFGDQLLVGFDLPALGQDADRVLRIGVEAQRPAQLLRKLHGAENSR